ncbi:hypothetical protein HOI83_02600 [Candidatus Uhrbacteria bacterium]|jgi:hypothetical protein|nr:hypothetical protein [Candidatus Uhrbacteria bacterium]
MTDRDMSKDEKSEQKMRLAEVESTLKGPQEEFRDIKRRAQDSLATLEGDQKSVDIQKARAALGLE